MNLNKQIEQLQRILQCEIEQGTMSVQEWQTVTGESASVPGNWGMMGAASALLLQVQEQTANLLIVRKEQLSDTSKQLIAWTISELQAQALTSSVSLAGMSEKQRNAFKISSWILERLEENEVGLSLPDHLITGGRLYAEMIPFLLVKEQSGEKQISYKELERLLSSFLSEDILLIPLKGGEWLIWGPVSLLHDVDQDGYEPDNNESLDESLAALASAMHEMLASESIGECHLSVSYPVVPAKHMLEAAVMLRETINLGRKFHVGTSIHLPWLLQLERLLNGIPENQRTKYLEQSLKRADLFVESEMLSTLETFFSLDCNVSETAKKLYIHRNTLLYRLDKLKQETGLDVRQFRDAVLVKIILLLYKVTKRN